MLYGATTFVLRRNELYYPELLSKSHLIVSGCWLKWFYCILLQGVITLLLWCRVCLKECSHFLLAFLDNGKQRVVAFLQWFPVCCCIPVMMHGVQHCNPGEWKEGWIPFLENGKKGVVAFLYTSCMVTGMQSHPAARHNKNLWINITTLSWPLTFLLSFCVFFGAKFTKAKISTNHFITIILLDFVQKHFTNMHLEVAALFHNILYKINTSGPKRLCNGYSMTTIKQFFY